jgi:hypothetical protein
MIVSVNVGFLKMEILMLSCALCMVVSRKLMVLLCSNSAVNTRLGVVAGKSRNVSLLVQLGGCLLQPKNISCSQPEESKPHRHRPFL